ncbi:hypothetical protein HDV02_003592 [Globomyces sp. JEL0801]|nr:hypothetical protein HDV02_003592 [Globomyces sp. JEL0801]
MGNQVSKDQVFAYASETHKPLVQSSGSALENTRVVCTKIMPELLLPQKPIPTQYNEEELHQITFSDFSHSSNTVIACNKRLVAVTNNIGLLFNTTKLLLCCNFLEEIPPEIGYLKHLTVLSLSKNRLKTLPDTIYHLSKLKELSLADNQLVYLPSSIGSLKNLTQLALDNNKLKTLPTELGQLSKLEHLNISYNPLTTLPAELSKLKTLMTLVTTDCPFLLTEPESDSGTVLSLKELTARYIVRHNIAGIHILTHGLQALILKSQYHELDLLSGTTGQSQLNLVFV